MDFSQNYYLSLGIGKNSTSNEIKKSYYKLSYIHHPDKGGDAKIFDNISKAYDILMDEEKRKEYDIKSKWGNNYDEGSELLDYEFSDDSKVWDEDKRKSFKDKEVLHKVIKINDKFNGSVEYDRWVICKSCGGSGKDLKSKIEIRDSSGKIIKMFDAEDGCDFCEGSGKDFRGNDCSFCFGNGKVGSKDCPGCKGEKRILGRQKLSNIDFPLDKKELKIDFMGNMSRDIPGKAGNLWLLRD
jgi:DnaJ-class molecular chaperone